MGIFFYYGFIYMAHRIYVILRAVFGGHAPVVQGHIAPDDVKTAGDVLRVAKKDGFNPWEAIVVLCNTVWSMYGLTTHLHLLFLILLCISITHLYYSLRYDETKYQAFYMSHFLKLMTVILITFEQIQLL